VAEPSFLTDAPGDRPDVTIDPEAVRVGAERMDQALEAYKGPKWWQGMPKPAKIAVGVAAFSVGAFTPPIPGTLPFLLVGSYTLTKDSPTVRAGVRGLRKVASGPMNFTFQFFGGLEAKFMDSDKAQAFQQRIGVALPRVMASVEEVTRPDGHPNPLNKDELEAWREARLAAKAERKKGSVVDRLKARARADAAGRSHRQDSAISQDRDSAPAEQQAVAASAKDPRSTVQSAPSTPRRRGGGFSP